LMKMLANYEAVGTWRTRTFLIVTYSRTKWRSISTSRHALYASARPRVLDRVDGDVDCADVIVVYKGILDEGLWSSCRSWRSQNTSTTPFLLHDI
jgi:hypothetical protein